MNTYKIYEGFYELYKQGELSLQRLATYFMDAKVIQLDEQDIIVSSNIEKEV
jgi:hypothetical protein